MSQLHSKLWVCLSLGVASPSLLSICLSFSLLKWLLLFLSGVLANDTEGHREGTQEPVIRTGIPEPFRGLRPRSSVGQFVRSAVSTRALLTGLSGVFELSPAGGEMYSGVS